MNVYCKINGKLAKFVVDTTEFLVAIAEVEREFNADGAVFAVVN